MPLKIDAGILSPIPGTKRGQSFALYDMKSVGIWETDEITEADGEGTVLNIATRLRSMEKAFAKKSKPFTFSWTPTAKDERVLFNSILRRREFEMIVGIKDGNDRFWRLEFIGAKL